MDKGILVIILSACAASGAFIGSVTEALHTKAYADTLADPEFYHLVDKSGDPVRQEMK